MPQRPSAACATQLSADPLRSDVGTDASLSTAARVRSYLAWAIIMLGAVHVLATPYFVPGFTEAALWFASGGAAFILVGILNLFAVVSGHSIPRLGRVSLVTNAATTVFIVALVVAQPTGPQEFVALLLIIPTTGLSFTSRRPRAERRVA